jgi:hypothetical protein
MRISELSAVPPAIDRKQMSAAAWIGGSLGRAPFLGSADKTHPVPQKFPNLAREGLRYGGGSEATSQLNN